jgi:hypothetical protein
MGVYFPRELRAALEAAPKHRGPSVMEVVKLASAEFLSKEGSKS